MDPGVKTVLLQGDCLVQLESYPDNSIDCVITDPPYFIDGLDNKWSAKTVAESAPNSHIKHLPKGMKFDKKQVKDLFDFYLKVSRLLFQKMKPGGYFLSFSSPRLYHAIAMACEIAGFEVRDMINWVYTQSMPKGMSVSHLIDKLKIEPEEREALKKEYQYFKTPMIKSCCEPICVAMKPTDGTFVNNELNFRTGLIDFSHKVGIDSSKVPANIVTPEEFHEVYDKNFLIDKPKKGEKGEDNTHPTVKPVKLMEHLIQIFCKKGATVLDPFMGSGTTGVACKQTGRGFVGIELNPEYFTIAQSRIDVATRPT